MKSSRLPEILLCTLALLLITSCQRNRVFEENQAIPGGLWTTDNRLVFKPMISDSAARYNFYFNIRNDLSYPYANLFLFLKTRFPDGRIARDTLECQLAGPDGRWLGSGMGDVRFSRFLFQEGISFPRSGIYHFEVEQAMRVKELKGIMDVGILIELSTSQ